MTKEDILASFFVRIARLRDELQAIEEIVPENELVITALLGLPTSWSAFSSSLNNWKETPTFEQLWNACSQEEVRISLVSNAYSAHHKNKGNFKKCKGPRRKIDLSKIECYNCLNMGHYKSDCLDNPNNKKGTWTKLILLKKDLQGRIKPKNQI